MSEIHFFSFSSKYAPSSLRKKVGPHHSVCSIPDSLSCPFSSLPLTSLSRHENLNMWNWTGPRKCLLQLHYFYDLESHHSSPRCMLMVFRERNKGLNVIVVHTLSDEGSTFPRESVSPTSNMRRLRKGEI